MALIRCNECGQMMSDQAQVCPRCGKPLQMVPQYPQQQPARSSNNNLWLYGLIGALAVLAIVVIILLISSMGGKKDTTPPPPPSQATVQQAPASAPQAAPQQAAPAPAIDLTEDGSYHLTGSVAGAGCQMDITIRGGEVFGTYSYNRYRKPLHLEGSINGTRVSLIETDNHGEQSGELNGNVSGNTFSGTHTRLKTMADTHFSFTAK